MIQAHISQLQSAFHLLLNNDDMIGQMVSGIYDAAPENVLFPYITISNIEVQDASARQLPISDIRIELNIWSAYQGRAELYEISKKLNTLIINESLRNHGADQLVTVQKVNQTFTQLNKQRVMQSRILYRAIMQGEI